MSKNIEAFNSHSEKQLWKKSTYSICISKYCEKFDETRNLTFFSKEKIPLNREMEERERKKVIQSFLTGDVSSRGKFHQLCCPDFYLKKFRTFFFVNGDC